MTAPATDRPTRIGAIIALGAGVMGGVAIGGYSLTGLSVAIMGVVILAIGLLLPRPGIMTMGAAGLFLAAMLAGVDGAPIGSVLVGTIGAIVAWDAAHNAASHGRQVGADAPTRSPEAFHAAASFGVGILTAGVAYGGFRTAARGQPAMAVGILLFGTILAVLAFR